MKTFDQAAETAILLNLSYHQAMRLFERSYLKQILASNRGNQCRAAEELGIHRNTLHRAMRQTDLCAKLRRVRK